MTLDFMARTSSQFVRPSQETAGLSVPARIATRASAHPAALALADGKARLNFEELERASNQLAAYLKSLGVTGESCVALLFDRSADFVVSALAVMKAGAAYLPLDSSTPAERAAYILGDSGTSVLLTHQGKGQLVGGGSCRVVDVDGVDRTHIVGFSAASAQDDVALSSLAYVIYTSGSTGKPKGVEITHGNLCNLVDWHNDAFSVVAEDRASQVAGLGFDAAVWEIWPYLAAGASLHIVDDTTRRSPQTLSEWLIQERITIGFVPTALAEQMLQMTWPAGTALRAMLTGADTLRRRPAANLPFVFVNNYGPTECTVVATSGTVSANGPTGQPSIGRAISGTQALILDEKLAPVAPGESGELCIAGANVGRGYRNNPEMTASRFVDYSPADGPVIRIYRTGDRAKLLENGEIAFLGRLDDQVKIRGYRIEPGEVIASLDRLPGIVASAVVARESSEGDAAGPALAAYVVPAPAAKLTAAGLREALAATLPDYMIPQWFVKLEALPMTANGKLDRAALPVPGAANQLPGGAAESAAPAQSGSTEAATKATDLEKRINEMVAALLGHGAFNREDNFFMVGGHSMLGVQLAARIRDAFGVKLTLRQLFGLPTVAALSAEVARRT